MKLLNSLGQLHPVLCGCDEPAGPHDCRLGKYLMMVATVPLQIAPWFSIQPLKSAVRWAILPPLHMQEREDRACEEIAEGIPTGSRQNQGSKPARKSQ